MSNSNTSDKSWSSLPGYTNTIIPSYPWWFIIILALWTLLALFWCWFLIFLFLLRYCSRQYRQRQYTINQKSLRKRLFDINDMEGQQHLRAETKYYDIEKDYSSDKSNQEIQTYIQSSVIIINMADERIIEDPNWENANPIEYNNLLSISNNDRSSQIKLTTAKIIFNDPLLFQQFIKYEKQPNIYTHQSYIQEKYK